MSCRVIGRTFEQFHFGAFVTIAQTLGYESLIGEYMPTSKNALVKDLYITMGCGIVSIEENGTTAYTLSLKSTPLPCTKVRRLGASGEAFGY